MGWCPVFRPAGSRTELDLDQSIRRPHPAQILTGPTMTQLAFLEPTCAHVWITNGRTRSGTRTGINPADTGQPGKRVATVATHWWERERVGKSSSNKRKATGRTKSELGIHIKEDRKLTAEVLKAMTERKSSEVLILLKGSDELLNPENSEKPLPFACVQKAITQTRKNTLKKSS